MKKFRKFLGKFLLYFFLISLFLLGSSLVLGYVYRDEVTREIIQWLAKQLNANVKIRAVDLSFIEEFPKVSVIFYDFDASLKQKYSFPTSKVLQGKKVKIKLNPYDLVFHKKYVIEELKLEDGKMFLYEKNGKWNYEYFFSNFEGKQTSSPVKLVLEKVTVLRSDLDFRMASTKLNLQGNSLNVFLYGVFAGNIYLTSQVNWQELKYKQGNSLSFDFPKSLLRFVFKYQGKNHFVFPEFTWETLSLKLSGQGKLLNKNLDLHLKTRNTQLVDVLRLLPENLQKQYATYRPEGKFLADLRLSGETSSRKLPVINASVEVRDASFVLSDSLGKIRDIRTKFHLNYNPNLPEKSSFSLLPTTLRWKNIPLKIQATVTDFPNPSLHAQILGKTKTEILVNLIPEEKLPAKIQGGTLDFNLKIQGKLRKLREGKQDKNNFISGNIRAENLIISYGNKRMHLLYGEFKPVKKNLLLKNTRFRIGKSDFLLNGKISNYLASEKIVIHLNTRSENVNLADLFFENNAKTKDTSSLSYEIVLNSLIKNLTIAPLKTRNVHLHLRITPEAIAFQKVLFKAFQGEVFLSKGIFKDNLLSFSYDLRDIELKDFFKTYPELAELTDVGKYLSGKISSQGKTKFKIVGTSLDYKSFFAEGKALGKQLRILNYAPLYDLGKFLKIESLKDARFEDIQTEYFIKDEKIYIAKTFVRVNEFKLYLEGWQSFQGELHYDLRFFLPTLQLFRKKAKELGLVEEIQSTKVSPSLFIKIRGTTEHPEFHLDKQAVKEKIRQDIQEEGKEFKEKIRKTEKELFGREDTSEVETLIEEEEKKSFPWFKKRK